MIFTSMQPHLTYLLVLFSFFPAWHQTPEIEQLKEQLEQAEADSAKVDALVGLANKHINVEPQVGLNYVEQALQLIKSSKDIILVEKSYPRLYHLKGSLYLQSGAYDSSEYYNMLTLTLSQTDTVRRIRIFQNLGVVKMRQNSYDESAEMYNEKVKLINAYSGYTREEKQDLTVKTKGNMGALKVYTGDYVNARKYFLEAIAIYKEQGDSVGMGRLMGNLAITYYFQEDYDDAIQIVKEAIKINEALKANISVIIGYQNLGAYQRNGGDPGAALLSHRTGINLALTLNARKDLASGYENLALDFKDLKQPDSALFYYNQALTLAKEFKNNDLISQILNGLARLFEEYPEVADDINLGLESNDPIAILEESKAMALEYVRLEYLQTVLLALSRSYELAGDYQKAFENMNQYHLLKDSMFTKEKSEALAEQDVKYETEKKEQQLALQEAQLEQNQATISRQQTERNALIGGSLLLLVIAFAFYRNYQLKSRTNEELNEQKNIISKSLEERESLLKEIHHRVKNNLQVIASLLYLQSGKFEDESVKRVLEEGQGRVRSMALIHQKLYENEDLKSIPFEEYLRELVAEIKSSFGKDMEKVRLEVNAKNIFFDVDTAVPLGLIINELATNSFKYAFLNQQEGSFSIYLIEEDGEYLLRIKDDGVGIPEEIDLRKTKSLGLRLVRVLSQQLEGEYQFNGQQGTSFELRFAA